MTTILNLIIKVIRDQQALELKIKRSKVTNEHLEVMGV